MGIWMRRLGKWNRLIGTSWMENWQSSALRSTEVRLAHLSPLPHSVADSPVKGIVRLSPATSSSSPYTTHILNYAFGRYDLTPFPSLDSDPELQGVSVRLTVMGERGEVARRAKRFAEGLGAYVE